MKLIKADFDRRLSLPGVAEPVQRPVDIDRARTGFANLRSLRIYRFLAQSVIDGHAEEDEVLIAVLQGAVDLTMSEGNSLQGKHPITLSALGARDGHACVAYLPPNGAYKLIPGTDAEIAYARATPSGRGSLPTAFAPKPRKDGGASVVLEELTYAERLRMRVLQVDTEKESFTLSPLKDSEMNSEALLHVRTAPAAGAATIYKAGAKSKVLGSIPPESICLQSWDTVSAPPGERPAIQFAARTSAMVLAVFVG